MTVLPALSFPLAKPFRGADAGSDGLNDGAPARPRRPPWDSYARRGKGRRADDCAKERIAVVPCRVLSHIDGTPSAPQSAPFESSCRR